MKNISINILKFIEVRNYFNKIVDAKESDLEYILASFGKVWGNICFVYMNI